jgi:hypothetical protein
VKVVRVFIRVLLLLCASGNVLGAFAQETTRSGFAVVTLVSGNIAGLIATETLRNTTSSGVEEAIVAPAVLVTTASMLVPVGLVEENTTGIAITNPSVGTGGVKLLLTDQGGNVVMNTTIQLGPRGHFSRFLDEFFVNQPVGFLTPLLLTVSSEIPVAILALNFRGGDIASIPLTSLSSPMPVPPIANRPFVEPVFGPGQVVASSIGGSSSLIFAQVVVGGGWSTEIAIGNTSSGAQVIRIDFFGADGINTASLTDIVIPSRGVFFFSPGLLARPFI